jgi:hypothetical protein
MVDTPSHSDGEDRSPGSQPSSDEPAQVTRPPRTRQEGDSASSGGSGEDHAESSYSGDSGTSGSGEDTSHEGDHSASALSGDGAPTTMPTTTVPTTTVPTTPVTTVTAPLSES